MHGFVRNLITEWRRLELPFEAETVLVAVSGGADSVALLLAIDDLRKRKKLDLRIVVAHFDHKLRHDSFSDLEYVRELTAKHKFELAHGEWHRPAGHNLEQSARNARYEFLLKTAEKVSARYVLTAHTMSDQAETVLMNLIRGSGPDGLGGMRSTRELRLEIDGDELEPGEDPFLPFPAPTVKLVRPLLTWAKRRDTESFCVENHAEYCSDPMNEDLNFKRVWVRKVLIPMLEEVNPKIVDSLCRTAELLQPGFRVGETDLTTAASEAVPNTNIELKVLKGLDNHKRYAALRSWVRNKRGDLRGLSMKHIESIDRLIQSRKSGRMVELPGGTVVKRSGRLEWQAGKAEKG